MYQLKFIDLFVVKNFVLYRFFRISYNLTGSWNFDFHFFQVLTHCNFYNFNSIEKFH